MNQRADRFTRTDAIHRARLFEVEHVDREMVVSREEQRRLIHDLQIMAQHIVVVERCILFCRARLIRVVRIDAGDSVFGDEQSVAVHLDRALNSRIIGRDERLTVTAGKDEDVSFIQMSECLQSNVRLGHARNRHGRHDPDFTVGLALEHTSQHQAVDDGTERADVVGLDAIDAPCVGHVASEDVPSADHEGDVDAHVDQ